MLCGLDLFFDQVVVVEQLFFGWGDWVLFVYYVVEQCVGVFQDMFVGLQLIKQVFWVRLYFYVMLVCEGVVIYFYLFNVVQCGMQWIFGSFDGWG